MEGFTLLETLVVISLLGIIAGLTLPYSIESYNRGLAGTDRLLLIAALREARAEAMNETCASSKCTRPVSHGVSVCSDHITIFEGSDYENRTSSADEIIPFSEKENLAGSESSLSVVFAPGSADLLQQFEVSITGNDNLTEDITINTEGAISSSFTRVPPHS